MFTPPTDAEDSVVLYDVELTRDGVYELDSGSRTIFVERSRIRNMGVGRGFTSERPIVTVVVGALLILGAAWLLGIALPGLSVLVSEGGKVGRVAAVPFVLGSTGGVLLWIGLRRGAYLWMDVGTETRRFRLASKVDAREVSLALKQAKEAFGYAVDLPLPDESSSLPRGR